MSVPPCRRCQSPLEPEDIRCPICSLAAPEAARASIRVQARAEIVRCDSCGAAVSYAVEHHAPRCGFCGSVTHVERPVDAIEQPDHYLPFLLGPDHAQQALAAWLATRRGWFTPKDLARSSTLAGLTPLWWVGWICDAEAYVSWTADSDHGRRRAPWAPHAGHTTLSFRSLLTPASRGLSHEECAFLAPSFQLQTARSQPEGPVQHAAIERFDVQRSLARHLVLGSVQGSAAQLLQQGGYIPGARFRNVKVSALLSRLSTRRYALPSYVLAYQFDGRLYRAVVSGQDARYVHGRVPRSYRTLWIILGVAVGVVVLFMVGVIGLAVVSAVVG